MADKEKPEAEAKKKAPKVDSAKKEPKRAAPKAAKAAAPAPAPEVKEAKPKPQPALSAPKRVPEKSVKVTQVRSPAGRFAYQRATLRGLGLDRINRSRVLEDTPAVRGMIERVRHLVRIDPSA